MKYLFVALLLMVNTAVADEEVPLAGSSSEDGNMADFASDTPATTSTSVPKGNTDRRVIYKKRTNINFDDAIVEGTVSNPEGVYVVTPPEKQFGSLLKLRPNFHRELMRDALLLK